MITAHCLVKNEENYIWYSIMSVLNYVDKIIIWDTGSTDKAVEIIEEIKKTHPTKIDFKKLGEVDKYTYSHLRQLMLNQTTDGWVFILDGDEIWWSESIREVTDFIEKKGNNYESIIVPTINLTGDIFHYQEKAAGQYKFGNRIGHYALRFINRTIPGLHVAGDYGKEGYVDSENLPIQNRDKKRIKFINSPYIHATHLKRSSKDNLVMQRNNKLKHEIGIEFVKNFYYPETFFEERPKIVSNIWKNMDLNFKFRAYLETPLRKIKRRLT